METLLVIVIVGAITGWLTSVLTRGSLAGLAANVLVAISGAFLGSWIAGQFGFFPLEGSLFNTIVVAAVGACMLLTLMRILRLA